MVLRIRKYILNFLVKNKHIYKQVLLAFLAASGIFNYGIQSGWISPLQKVLQSDSSPLGAPISSSALTWVANMLTLPAAFGLIIHTYVADNFGRKIALLIILILQMLPWILLLISTSLTTLIIARSCSGLGSSGCIIQATVYIKETCQTNIIGSLVTMCVMSQYIGVMIIYILGSYLSYHSVLWVCLCISITSILLLILVAPETPPFFIKQGKLEKATALLASLRGSDINDETVQNEIHAIQTQYGPSNTVTILPFRTIIKNKAWRRGMVLCTLLQSCVAFNGTASIVTYAYSIITQSGIMMNPELQTLSVPCLMLIGSLAGFVFVNRLCRKTVLVWSFLQCFVGLAVLATTLLLTKYEVNFPNFLPVFALAITCSAYSMGLMTVPLIIMSEMFIFEVRAKLTGCITVATWVILAAQVTFCNSMAQAIGLHFVFYIFAAFSLSSAVFVMVCIPETKGRTPKQVEDLLLGKNIDAGL